MLLHLVTFVFIQPGENPRLNHVKPKVKPLHFSSPGLDDPASQVKLHCHGLEGNCLVSWADLRNLESWRVGQRLVVKT